MATRKIKSGEPQKNDGATILYGGNVAAGDKVNAPSTEIVGYRGGYGANIPEPSATAPTHKPFTGGTFAFVMEDGKYIMRGFTPGLSGIDNPIPNSPASDYGRRSINKIEHQRRLDETAWDYVTGAVTKGANAGHRVDYHSIRDNAAVTPNDDAANPSRENPGEFTFMEGGTPVNKDYEEKTG